MADVPEELHQFAAAAAKWGQLDDPDHRMRLARTGPDDPDIQELQAVANAWTERHQDALDEWADRVPLDDDQSAQFSFLLGLLDELDVLPESEPADLAERNIAALARFGSYRLASGRMFAAWELMHCGYAADRAIPALQRVLRDEDYRVRVWAHCSLAILAGDVEKHRRAIEFIRNERGVDERGLVGSFADSAFRELEKTQAERDLGAFCGACVMNDLATLRRLLQGVDVNGRNHDGTRALSLAVGNSHPRAVEFLLQHGADATERFKDGRTLLHDAAWRRRGEPAVVRALLEYGAEPLPCNEEGQSALDIAKEFNRIEDVRVLRQFSA